MKKFLENIWKFINSKFFSYILIFGLIIIFLGMCNRNNNLRDNAERLEQNLVAMSDTITSVVLKNGRLQSSIGSYIATEKELRNINKDLAEEVKNQKGDVVTLNKIIFRLKNDSLELAKRVNELEKILNEPIQMNDSTWNLGWTASYNNIGTISGNSIVGVRADQSWLPKIKLTNEDIIISNIDIPISIVWGQKYDENGKLLVYAETDYPGFKTELLKGTYVDIPKEKHWFTGFGIGPQFGVTYDFIHNQPALTIGIGVQYNVYHW